LEHLIMIDLTAPTQRVAELVVATADDQLDSPTPCDDMSVRALLAHVYGLSIAFRDAARKIDGPTTNTAPDPSVAALPDDWRSTVPVALTELAEAWRESGAWQGMTKAGGQTLPAEVTGAVALDEVVLHGWDLAVATGQPYAVDQASLTVVEQFCSGIGDDPAERQGLFGPRVLVAHDAPQLERVLGMAGRDPNWPKASTSRPG
jgi:uncharacterized protein (TIGR03086 family)